MYPVNLFLENRSCLVIGGGQVARQKVQGLLAARAAVTVIAPAAEAGLQALADNGEIIWKKKAYAPGDEADFYLVICAADDPEVNHAAARAAQKRIQLVCVCDDIPYSSFAAPSVLRRGDVLLTFSTNGKSPSLSRWLRRHFEQEIGPEYGPWLERLNELRIEARQLLPTSRMRQSFWRQALTDGIMDLVRQQKLEEAYRLLHQSLLAYKEQTP